MVRLPNAHQAIIDPRKLADYLLSDTHPVGRIKARFFRSFGFRRDAPEELAAALLAHAAGHDASELQATLFGVKYLIGGPFRHRMAVPLS